jgi:hypothetical protein
MYKARRVLTELGHEIPFFAAAAGPVSDVGVDLKVNLLASKTETVSAAIS